MSGAKPRILFVAPSAYILSGLATWLDYLAPGLDGRGWETTLGLTKGLHHDPSAYRAVHSRGRAIAVENPTGSPEGRVRAIIEAIRRVRADLVVSVNIPDSFVAVERLRGGGRCGPRVVMTVHSIDAWAMRDVARWQGVLDGVICTNRLACRLVQVEGCTGGLPVYYAPCGVTMRKGGPIRPEWSGLRIAFVGRLETDQKRVMDLVGVVRGLSELGVRWKLRVAGEGPEANRLGSALGELPEPDCAEWLGFLRQEELSSKVYEWADVIVVTSVAETGPIVIWEAMANDVVVVSSRYIGTGLEGSLRDGENCLLFPVGDVAAAARCLGRLTDVSLRARLVTVGRRLVTERYERGISVSKWDEALRAVMATPARKAGGVPWRAPVAGRLDRLLGAGLGETVRRLTGRRFRHREAGGEWPHTHSEVRNDAAFWELAAALDRGETWNVSPGRSE